MPKPPMDPDSFDKVNFVIDAWVTGCDAPWYIYIETMKPALLTAFITLVTFGWDDVVRGYFRPRGLYKRRTGKRKGKWVRRIPRFPELGNTLGTKLPGATEVKGVKWNSLGKTLWRIDGVMEVVRFWWLVAAITEDFAFDWTSLLYESYWCQDGPHGQFSFQTIGWFNIHKDNWKLAGFGTKDYERGPPNWAFQSGSTGTVSATVTAALSVKKAPAYPEPESFRVVVRDKFTAKIYCDSGVNDQLVNGGGAAVAMGVLPPFTSFEVRAYMTGPTWALYGEGVVIGVEVLE